MVGGGGVLEKGEDETNHGVAVYPHCSKLIMSTYMEFLFPQQHVLNQH